MTVRNCVRVYHEHIHAKVGLYLGGRSVLYLCGGGDEIERHDVSRLAIAAVRARAGELCGQHVTHHGHRRRVGHVTSRR